MPGEESVDSGGGAKDDPESSIVEIRSAQHIGAGEFGSSQQLTQRSDASQHDNLWLSMGIHRADDSTRASVRKRRMSKHCESLELTPQSMENLAPGARVMFLLKEKNDAPALFTEMGELTRCAAAGGGNGDANIEEWKETARWVKFEEDVEEGGNRWSKPHVATLSLHALFQLRSCLLNGAVFIDLEAESLPHLIERILDELIRCGHLQESERDDMRHILTRRHTHQYEQAKSSSVSTGNGSTPSGFLSAVRSISDIGRSFSHGKNLNKHHTNESALTGISGESTGAGLPATSTAGNQLELPKVGSLPRDIHRDASQNDINRNAHFMKKLPVGAEASNILVGEVDFLQRHVTAFIRLKDASILGDFTEVPVPTRFLFLLLGPMGNAAQFKEIGRAMATLMSDEIFHDVAYKARYRNDLLDGVDEFLDAVTVLPPGEWDPAIRIEPPTVIPSQQKRVQVELPTQFLDAASKGGGKGNGPPKKGSGGSELKHLEDEDGHGSDPALQRTGRWFGGLRLDLQRKLPHYKSDFTDAFNLQCVAAFCFMYFALLAPIVTFGGLLEEATHQRMVSYITRFTEESFATLIAVIFIYEAFVKLFKIKEGLNVIEQSWPDPTRNASTVVNRCHCVPSGASIEKIVAAAHKNHLDFLIAPNATSFDYSKIALGECKRLLGILEGDNCFVMYDRFLMSMVLMFATFLLATTFKKMRNSCYFPSRVRQTLSDFAVMISITIMTLFDLYIGVDTPKLNVPSTFRPTWHGRGWFIPPFDGNPIWTAPLAAVPALLACILIFMDQQITAVIVNRKENKLKKGCGYHLDLLVLSFLIIIVGVLGLPVYVAATVLSINHVNALKRESESRAPGEVAHFIGVCEQRVTGTITFLLIGMSVLMTKVLGHIPMPVLYGVFLYMGISALGGIQLFDRILLMLMPMKYQPDTYYIRHVPIGVIHKYTLCQAMCLGVLWVVKSIKATSMSFPIMLVVMVAVRKLMEKFFSEKDLKYLDDKMPDFHLRKKEDMRRKSKTDEIEIDLDENQGTIHAVKTEAHLHIYSETESGTQGNVIKIPLSAINEPSHNINISRELNSSGMWKHITSESKASLQNFVGSTGASEHENPHSPRLATPDEDDEAITINIVKPPSELQDDGGSSAAAESQPLLRKKSQGKSEHESPV